MNRTPLKCVIEFHKAFGQPVSEEPKLDTINFVVKAILTLLKKEVDVALNDLKEIPDANQRVVRLKLLVEEFSEYLQAESESDIVEIADALADIQYIINGTAASYGIPLDEIFYAVHDNNMTKLGPDGKPILVNGKVQKPAHYKPVDLTKFFK